MNREIKRNILWNLSRYKYWKLIFVKKLKMKVAVKIFISRDLYLCPSNKL